MARTSWLTVLAALVAAYLVWRRMHSRVHRTARIAPSGERVAILGASTEDGLGATFLQHYLERGARQVVIVGRRRAALEAVREAVLRRVPTKHPDAVVHVFAADCTKTDDVAALRDFLLTELRGLDTLQIVFGVTSILPVLGLANVDPLGVNASDAKTSDAVHPTAEGLSSIADTVQHSCDGNIKGTAIVLGALVCNVRLTQIPVLQTTSADPVVVGTGSVAGLVPAPTRAVYCATKSAQHYLLDCVALECESQAGCTIPGTDQRRALVRFLIVAPGPIKNSFVKTYAVDSRSGPRDDRNRALDVHDVVRETLAAVDADHMGMLVLPRHVFWVSILTKFATTYVFCLPPDARSWARWHTICTTTNGVYLISVHGCSVQVSGCDTSRNPRGSPWYSAAGGGRQGDHCYARLASNGSQVSAAQMPRQTRGAVMHRSAQSGIAMPPAGGRGPCAAPKLRAHAPFRRPSTAATAPGARESVGCTRHVCGACVYA